MSVNEKMTAIADAIRAKTGGTAPLSLDAMAVAIEDLETGGGSPLTLTVTVATGAVVTATNGDQTITKISVNGVAVLTLPDGGTWTVTAANGDSIAPTRTIVVEDSFSATLIFATGVLNDDPWDTVQAVAVAGEAPNYYSIGDTKGIVLNGTLGTLALTDAVIYPFIIGFNHNAELEGDNLIHFQIGKMALSDGLTVALSDGAYRTASLTNTKNFIMKTSAANAGGWQNSPMRKTVLGTSLSDYPATSLIAVIPGELRAVLAAVVKYTDNTGGTTNTEENITATVEYVFLPSEYEFRGALSYASAYEKNYTKQYAYYAAGNTTLFYLYASNGTPARYWTRSPRRANTERWVYFDSDGGITAGNPTTSFGITPCFCVGGAAA